MTSEAWEQIVQQIVSESNLNPKTGARHRLLIEWRAKLEHGPTQLLPYKIDEIIREVRRRLENQP